MGRLNVKAILFDLDHTLWDFARNSREAIHDIFTEEKITDRYNIPFGEFYTSYIIINDRMWERYRKGSLSRLELRNQRFLKTLEKFNVNDVSLAQRFSERYLELSPYKKHLFPGTHEMLQYLQKKYPLVLITNGFNEVQYIKIRQNGLEDYFSAIVTSEDAGVQKPSPVIFHMACERSGMQPANCVMVGDDWQADMMGAKKAGLQRIHFDPDKKHTQPIDYRIHELNELQTLL